ncbi:MAG: NAD(P)H-binding protein [Streptosporangiaceae bacterium]
MIIVTGANGQLGRAITERLLDHVPAAQVGVSVRDPQQARALEERGVRVRRGDFTDPASLRHAFEGAEQVLIVSADSTGAGLVRAHRLAIEAAVAAGAKRILYTSHMGVSPSSPFPPMVDHAATEAILRDSGVAYTTLRNGFYASTVPMLLGAALKTGELAAPEDGPVAWTAHADLADVTALALAEDGLLDGVTPPLTAAEAIDMTGVAEIASHVTGHPVRRIVVSDADYRASLLAHGLPEAQADMLVGLFIASRHGDFVPADPALAALLGRPPITLADYLKEALAP